MADVFISYRRTERPLVQPIVNALRELKLSVWFDANLSSGDRFRDEINREVQSAKVVFVCWSPDALERPYVQGEAQIGVERQTLVSTWIAGPDNPSMPIPSMPVPYNSLQMDDLRSWIASPDNRSLAWRSVLRSIGRLTGRADLVEWSELDEGSSIQELTAWLQTRSEDHPFAPDIMDLLELRRAQAADRRRGRPGPRRSSPPSPPPPGKTAPSVWRRLFGGAGEIAIDLGTANTRIYVPGAGIVLNEPSVVAVENVAGEKRVKAVGDEVEPLLTRRPESVETTGPLRRGVIEDVYIAEAMLRHFVRKARSRCSIRSIFDIVIGSPAGAGSVYRRALRDAAKRAGAKEVRLIETPMAAAIGAGMDFRESAGSLIVEIGAGKGEVAVVSVRGLTCPLPFAANGVGMDNAIIDYLRWNHSVLIDPRTAERVKKRVGLAPGPDEGESVSIFVRGNSTYHGIPKEMAVSQRQVTEALKLQLAAISQALYQTMENSPPQHSGTVVDRGIVLTGGVALLQGLDQFVHDETGLPVRVADDPLHSVVNGMGRVLEDSSLRSLLFTV
jgi:rod shape-determining protein MreB